MSRDKDLNAYTSEGRIPQIEYAMKASNLGTTTLGIIGEHSVVLISERKIVSKLAMLETPGKHVKIFDRIAVAYSGIGSDSKEIINKAREFCLNHERIYNEHPSLEGLLKYLSSLALKFSEKELNRKIFSRPFGVNMLFAGFEEAGPVLYSFDPSGSFHRLKARGIGSASQAIDAELKDVFQDNMSDEELIRTGLSLTTKVMKDKATQSNVEICIVNNNGVCFYTPQEIGWGSTIIAFLAKRNSDLEDSTLLSAT